VFNSAGETSTNAPSSDLSRPVTIEKPIEMNNPPNANAPPCPTMTIRSRQRASASRDSVPTTNSGKAGPMAKMTIVRAT